MANFVESIFQRFPWYFLYCLLTLGWHSRIVIKSNTVQTVSLKCNSCDSILYLWIEGKLNKNNDIIIRMVRKASVEAGIWRNAICYNTWNELLKWTLINSWDTVIALHGHHFVRHPGICNPICVKLLQLMTGVITLNSLKKNEVSILINGWDTANYSVPWSPFCPPSWNL